MAAVLGITGIIGTGKSAVAKYLAEKYGYEIIDVDAVGHKLLEKESELYPKIIKEFKTNNRKKIATQVFKDSAKLQKLNKILHPVMFRIVKAEVEALKKQNKKIIIEAALLFQIGLDIFCDRIICLKSSTDTIYGRLIQKGLNKKQINERLNSAPTIPEEEVISIENNSDIQELQIQINTCILKEKILI